MLTKSDIEEQLAWQLKAVAITMVREYRFCPWRRWRFDFADVGRKIAVEIEGLIYIGKGKQTRLGGRHVSVKGFSDDCDKYNYAAILGWRVLRVTPKMVKTGDAMKYIDQIMKADS